MEEEKWPDQVFAVYGTDPDCSIYGSVLSHIPMQ